MSYAMSFVVGHAPSLTVGPLPLKKGQLRVVACRLFRLAALRA
jgi:hypothetical protein